MTTKSILATAALIGSALVFSAPAFAADPAPAQQKPAAAKPLTTGTINAVDCAKLTDAKAKDECVKKANAAAGTPKGTTTGNAPKPTADPAAGGASKY
jgi:hypothetical protein